VHFKAGVAAGATGGFHGRQAQVQEIVLEAVAVAAGESPANRDRRDQRKQRRSRWFGSRFPALRCELSQRVAATGKHGTSA
jgi:hypothetical protein